MRKKINLKMCRNVILFLALIIFTYFMIFKDQDMNEIIEIIKRANTKYILLGIFFMFMYFFMESYNIKKILSIFGNKINIFKALKFTFIGYFFSSITPAATGGQPIEIYYMTKENIKGANATLALLIQLCGFQISTIFLGIICAILNGKVLVNGLIWLFLLGLTINGFALCLMLIGVFSKKLTKKLVDIFISILAFFKVKNLDIKRNKIQDGLEEYNESSIFIKEHKLEFIKAIFRVFIQISCSYMVPFCVYKAFNLGGYNLFQMFTMQAVLYTTVSSLPLPGAIGVSESVFLTIFKPAFGENLLGSAMLLSRGITFYLYVIISLIVVVFNAVKTKNVKGEIDNKVINIEKECNELNISYSV